MRINQTRGVSSSLNDMTYLRNVPGWLPGPAGYATKEYGSEDSEGKRCNVRQLHTEVSKEQHQQPSRWQREQSECDCENK